MTSHTETPLQRVQRVCATAAERIVRDLYKADRMGEPPANVIAYARDLAMPPPHIVDAVTSEIDLLSDEFLAAAFDKVFRPKFKMALALLRPS